MSIYALIRMLIVYAMENGLVNEFDSVVVGNSLMELIGLDKWEMEDIDHSKIPEFPQLILDQMCDHAIKNKIIEDGIISRDLFDTKIMGILMPRASEVVNDFYYKFKRDSAVAATDWYYRFSQKTNYIRTDRIAKNLHWISKTEYGDMEITINLSKPEKDPLDIAREKSAPQSGYPKCLLCCENVGYPGRINHPARQNHRVIPVDISSNGGSWFLQYSPYVYYNEHAIVFCSEHRPMKIDISAFDRMTKFVEKFPHYFLGSNADLPIVGGSILTHDHYQGGHHEFPMAKAKIEKKIIFKDHEKVEAGIVKWPMSVIRITSEDRDEMVRLSDKILKCWREYSDKALDILAHSADGTPHSTITPICRKIDKKYQMDLVLRNNRTTKEYPLGIFHPHSEVHNIKKENIGLIEVMGLAVLPSRLKEELGILAGYMVQDNWKEKIRNDDKVLKHLDWATRIIERAHEHNIELTKANIKDVLEKEVGNTFSAVLEYAGVYKRDDAGKKGFDRFIKYVNEK